MKNKIYEYFYYSRLERNGILVLSLLCVLGFLLPVLLNLKPGTAKTNFSSFEKEIEAFNQAYEEVPELDESIKPNLIVFDPNTASKQTLQQLGIPKRVVSTLINFRNKGGKFFKKEDLKKVYGLKEDEYKRLEHFIEIASRKNDQSNTSKYIPKEKKIPAKLFNFDPNKASLEELEKLGFPKRAANNLLKFRAKGGVVRTKEELSKIYGIDEAFFERLFPFIIIEDLEKVASNKALNNSNTSTFQETIEKEKTFFVEINTASENDWQKLKGIGPFYAKRIAAFREKLGGFYSVDQIKEVYGLPDSTFQSILPFLKIENLPEQMDLNNVTEKELATHPYLKFKQAKIIINYRDQHGPFSNLDELDNIIPLDSKLIEKLKPYLFVQ